MTIWREALRARSPKDKGLDQTQGRFEIGRVDTLGHGDDVSVTVRTLLRRPAGYLPLAMSLGALATIAWFVALHGVVHQADEGTQAHLWQLLVAGQLPLIAFFAVRWLPDAPRPAIVVLALQATALMVLALAPLWALGGL